MGYCVDIQLLGLTVPADKVHDCLVAINKLHAPGTNYPCQDHYSWVGNPPASGFPTLADALSEWRYGAVQDEGGNVKIECFTGEKLGDDEILYDAIAPFLEPGAEIYCQGEDGAFWKYIFKDGKKIIKNGKVVYEE